MRTPIVFCLLDERAEHRRRERHGVRRVQGEGRQLPVMQVASHR